MAITFRNYDGTILADVRTREGATYGITFIKIGHYVSASLEVYDLEYGPQGSRVEAAAETRDVHYNVRKCLAVIAEWAVRNLSGWRVCEALEVIGEAMKLAD